MSEDKNNANVKEQGQHKGSCDSQQPQSCDKEDKTKDKDAQKAECQPDAKKAEQNTSHKHGGSCSH